MYVTQNLIPLIFFTPSILLVNFGKFWGILRNSNIALYDGSCNFLSFQSAHSIMSDSLWLFFIIYLSLIVSKGITFLLIVKLLYHLF